MWSSYMRWNTLRTRSRECKNYQQRTVNTIQRKRGKFSKRNQEEHNGRPKYWANTWFKRPIQHLAAKWTKSRTHQCRTPSRSIPVSMHLYSHLHPIVGYWFSHSTAGAMVPQETRPLGLVVWQVTFDTNLIHLFSLLYKRKLDQIQSEIHQ